MLCLIFIFSACSSKTVHSSTVSFYETVEGAVAETTITINSISDNSVLEENKDNHITEKQDDKLIWTGENLNEIIYLQDIDLNLIEDTIKNICVKKLNNDFTFCDNLSNIKIAIHDMNDDGLDDYFILPFPYAYIGNSLPPIYLFINNDNGDSYKIVNIPLKTDSKIKILNSKTNDYYDLQLDSFGNILNFNGIDSYISYNEQNIDVSYLPVTQEGDVTCIKIIIPYGISNYESYYLKMCIFDNNFNKIIIATSNDNKFNEIKYTNLPTNGIYCFYIKTLDLNNFDYENFIFELKCVEAV